MAKQKKKGGCGTIFLAIIVLGIAGMVFGNGNDKKEDNQVSNEYTETVKSNSKNNEKEPEMGVEVKTDFPYGDISDFDYDIEGDTIFLHSYDGNRKIVEIKNSYIIDEKDYKVDISDFQVSNSGVNTLILDDGFTEVYTPIFNSCGVKNVFFPKTMMNVYDNTLSYLHPNEGEKIQIYYEGTKEEWLNIFTEYKRTKVEDAEFGEEMGTAVADKINEMMGSGYDSSEFEYYFSANASDLKE